MSSKEVSASFKAFKKEAGSEKIQLDKFTKLVANMNTNTGEEKRRNVVVRSFTICGRSACILDVDIAGGNVAEYAKHLFRAFDTDVDGYVSFEEVIVGFHHLSGGGDEKEKMKIVFRVSKRTMRLMLNHQEAMGFLLTTLTTFTFRYTTRTATGSYVQQTSRSKITH